MYKNIREIFVFVVEVLDYLCHNTKAHGYSRAFRFQVWQEKLSRFQRHKEKRIAYIICDLSCSYLPTLFIKMILQFSFRMQRYVLFLEWQKECSKKKSKKR